MIRALLIEETSPLHLFWCALLEAQGIAVHSVSKMEEAFHCHEREPADCFITELNLPDGSARQLASALRGRGDRTPVVVVTAHGSIEAAVEAMRSGASHFLTKPIDPARLSQVIHELTGSENAQRSGRGRRKGRRTVISASAAMKELLVSAKRVARVDSSVFLLGESGVGKEVIARYIHSQSPRSERPFVALNCGAIPASLLESELFGHEEGAFTGATQRRIGIFEHASQGTVFLDELAEMAPNVQVKLLRALQEREIKRVGGNEIIQVSPRIIAATNQDIERCLATRQLREDLYYRLAIVELRIPPLRQRKDDVGPLVEFFRQKVFDREGRTASFSQEAMRVLEAYDWPGNVRELENVVERSILLCDGVVKPADLQLGGLSEPEYKGALHEVSEQASIQAERRAIEQALSACNGNKAAAARFLGVSYKTILNKLREYDISFQGSSPVDSARRATAAK